MKILEMRQNIMSKAMRRNNRAVCLEQRLCNGQIANVVLDHENALLRELHQV